VHVDPMKPTLKAHGTKRLKLEYDEWLTNFAFKFNLRLYTEVGVRPAVRGGASGRACLIVPFQPQAELCGP